METDFNTIRIGHGLGGLRFGASREDVRLYAGEPDDVDEELQGISQAIHWVYENIGIDLYFDGEDDFRLGTLRTERKEAKLFGARLIGFPEEWVRSYFQDQDLGPRVKETLDFSDHPQLHRLIFSKCSIEFWFKHHKLNSIMWNYLIDDNDQVCWPTKD